MPSIQREIALQHRMSRCVSCASLVLAAALFTGCASSANDRQAISTDREQIQSDRQNLVQNARAGAQADRTDIRNDRTDVTQDRASISADRSNMTQAQDDIRADQSNMRADIAQDRSNIRADERDIRQDRQDIRADQANLRNDRAIMAASQSAQGNGWNKPNAQTQQRTSRNAVEPMKASLTPSTVANNAAENTHKTQTTQNLQKAWWHVW